MMWTKLTIDTTVEAVDLISAFLDEKGVEGVMIEDHVPLTEEDKAAMFVDIPLVDGVDDGTAKDEHQLLVIVSLQLLPFFVPPFSFYPPQIFSI